MRRVIFVVATLLFIVVSVMALLRPVDAPGRESGWTGYPTLTAVPAAKPPARSLYSADVFDSDVWAISLCTYIVLVVAVISSVFSWKIYGPVFLLSGAMICLNVLLLWNLPSSQSGLIVHGVPRNYFDSFVDVHWGLLGIYFGAIAITCAVSWNSIVATMSDALAARRS